MKTDRELLELAAKAAGYDFLVWNPEISQMSTASDYSDDDGSLWKPLNDDGDALRLAIKLGMVVQIDLNHCECAEVEASEGVLVIIQFDDAVDNAVIML